MKSALSRPCPALPQRGSRGVPPGGNVVSSNWARTSRVPGIVRRAWPCPCPAISRMRPGPWSGGLRLIHAHLLDLCEEDYLKSGFFGHVRPDGLDSSGLSASSTTGSGPHAWVQGSLDYWRVPVPGSFWAESCAAHASSRRQTTPSGPAASRQRGGGKSGVEPDRPNRRACRLRRFRIRDGCTGRSGWRCVFAGSVLRGCAKIRQAMTLRRHLCSFLRSPLHLRAFPAMAGRFLADRCFDFRSTGGFMKYALRFLHFFPVVASLRGGAAPRFTTWQSLPGAPWSHQHRQDRHGPANMQPFFAGAPRPDPFGDFFDSSSASSASRAAGLPGHSAPWVGLVMSPDGYIVTNNHVVEAPTPQGQPARRGQRGSLLRRRNRRHGQGDGLALLKIRGQCLPAVPVLGDSDASGRPVGHASATPFGSTTS